MLKSAISAKLSAWRKVLITALLLTGAQFASAKDVEIGVVLTNLSDKFVTYLQEGVERYANENDEVKLTLTDAAGDSATLLNQVENFIDKKVDAVLIQPTDRRIVKSVGKKLANAGIPLIVINHYPEADDRQYMKAYVGSQERQAGLLQAKAVVKLLNGKSANVAILLGPLGLEAQIERTAGNKEVFERYDNINVVLEQEGRWDRARAMGIVDDWLQGNNEINVIIANNDEMAIGAWLAAEKAGKTDADIIIAGIDATPDALAYLGKGLDITIYQDARGQGYYGMQAAHQAALGQTPKALTWIDFETVLPENREQYEKRY